MKRERNNCPTCQAPAISPWASFAYWPLSARCNNCGVRVRAKIPGWQNLLVQCLGQGAFWAALLFGVSAGLGGLIAGFFVGIVLAVLIAMVPGFFSKLEALPE